MNKNIPWDDINRRSFMKFSAVAMAAAAALKFLLPFYFFCVIFHPRFPHRERPVWGYGVAV
jgi:hypothetical protein